MDILIDLIIYLIKQAAKSSGGSTVRPVQAPRPVAPPAAQVQAMQRTLAAQQARTRAAPKRGTKGPTSWAQPGVRAVVPPVKQPPVPVITPAEAVVVPPRPAPSGIPGLKLPFLLGEVLSQPVSLRDEEYVAAFDF